MTCVSIRKNGTVCGSPCKFGNYCGRHNSDYYKGQCDDQTENMKKTNEKLTEIYEKLM